MRFYLRKHRETNTIQTKNMKLEGISYNCINIYEDFQTFRINVVSHFSLISKADLRPLEF